MNLLFLMLLIAFLSPERPASGAAADSVDAGRLRIYTGAGNPASLDEILAAMQDAEVVLLGETHDDPVAHALQLQLLSGAWARYGSKAASGAQRPVALSLEMFERDVQPVLDEYLRGLITEAHFLAAGRPWPNYEQDYRPLVEFARAHGLEVLAANAPRRYVNRVSRLGPDALQEPGLRAGAALPPLPYAPASPAYRAKWDSLMAEMAAAHAAPAAPDSTEAAKQRDAPPPSVRDTLHAAPETMPSYLLEAQSLWDATMAYSLAELLIRRPEALALHIAGGFHVERRSGIADHLARYRPGVRLLTVAIRPAEDADTFIPARHTGLGDFVILTEARTRPAPEPGP